MGNNATQNKLLNILKIGFSIKRAPRLEQRCGRRKERWII